MNDLEKARKRILELEREKVALQQRVTDLLGFIADICNQTASKAQQHGMTPWSQSK